MTLTKFVKIWSDDCQTIQEFRPFTYYPEVQSIELWFILLECILHHRLSWAKNTKIPNIRRILSHAWRSENRKWKSPIMVLAAVQRMSFLSLHVTWHHPDNQYAKYYNTHMRIMKSYELEPSKHNERTCNYRFQK